MAFVGVTGGGKTTLVNALAGDAYGLVGAASDTTDQILEVRLQHRVSLYDTPGVGGVEDDNEAVTLQFLGLEGGASAPATCCQRSIDAGPCPKVSTNPSAAIGKQRCGDLRCPSLVDLDGDRPDVVVEVLAGHEGVGKSALSFHRFLVGTHPNPIVVQTVHRLRTPQQRHQGMAGAKRHGIENVIQLDCEGETEGLAVLQRAISDRVGRQVVWPDPLVDCQKCGATGLIACNCSAEKTACAWCRGRGWRMPPPKTCAACGGRGFTKDWWTFGLTTTPCKHIQQKREWCARCQGTGRVDCAICHGKTSRKCSVCHGVGKVPRSALWAR